MPRKYAWHDFQRPGSCLLTLKVAPIQRNALARVEDDGVHPSPLGQLVCEQWGAIEDGVKGAWITHAFQLMPDHLHALVEVLSPLPRPIGFYIGQLKARVAYHARRELGFSAERAIWAPGYDWRNKITAKEIEIAFAYVENNPAQLLLKRQAHGSFGKAGPIVHPRLPAFWPDSPAVGPPLAWTAFGNTGLLDGNAWALRVSRRASSMDIEALADKALRLARAGAVCISPAISPGEKKVFQMVVESGGGAILLVALSLGPRYHPASWAMPALAAGRFLVLSPVVEERRQDRMSRLLAERLNGCAAVIANGARG